MGTPLSDYDKKFIEDNDSMSPEHVARVLARPVSTISGYRSRRNNPPQLIGSRVPKVSSRCDCGTALRFGTDGNGRLVSWCDECATA